MPSAWSGKPPSVSTKATIVIRNEGFRFLFLINFQIVIFEVWELYRCWLVVFFSRPYQHCSFFFFKMLCWKQEWFWGVCVVWKHGQFQFAYINTGRQKEKCCKYVLQWNTTEERSQHLRTASVLYSCCLLLWAVWQGRRKPYFSLEEGRSGSDNVFCIISITNFFQCLQLKMTQDSVWRRLPKETKNRSLQSTKNAFGFARVAPYSYADFSGGISSKGFSEGWVWPEELLIKAP